MPPPSPTVRVLIADDQRDVLEALRLLLKPEGFDLETVSSPAGALAAAAARDFDVALVDLNYARATTSGREGLDLVTELKRLDSTLPVVVMTAWGSIELAVAAMRQGASDFVQKPWENERLLSILRVQAELARAVRASQRLEAENRALHSAEAPALVAQSPAMRTVADLVERVAPSEAAVLLSGENGTGKGLVARLLHARSTRASRAFVAVNVGGLPSGTFESELFGHVRGAFTDAKTDRAGRFEIADGGTLFLDEIGNLELAQQSRLLRVLETGEFERVGSSKTRRANVRLVSATNSDLAVDVAAGRFRQDLFFRLNTVEIRLPSLRDRREDIPPLASRFLADQASRYRRNLRGFTADAIRALIDYPWPGNVRELEHTVERAVLLARGEEIEARDLALPAPAGRPEKSAASSGLDEMSLEEVERALILKALDRFAGNVSQAAEALGLSRSALYRRFKRHGL